MQCARGTGHDDGMGEVTARDQVLRDRGQLGLAVAAHGNLEVETCKEQGFGLSGNGLSPLALPLEIAADGLHFEEERGNHKQATLHLRFPSGIESRTSAPLALDPHCSRSAPRRRLTSASIAWASPWSRKGP